MRRCCAALLLVLGLSLGAAQAQAVFPHSKVHFQADNRVDLEKARKEHEGNVFIFFYKKNHSTQHAADSVFLADERISRLLNEKYARFAIDLESDYARILFSQVEIGGPTEAPFVLLISLGHGTHQGIWSSWAYRHALPGVDRMMLDQMYWKLWNFADHGTTAPKEG